MSIANVFFAFPTIWLGGRCHKRSSTTIKNPSVNNRAENKPFSSSNVSNSHHHREHRHGDNGERFYPASTAPFATTTVTTSAAVASTATTTTTTTATTATTSAAILLSIALLAFPFLPAANLFFYVGFVVAERILYLPSVGYCLLIGLGVGKLIDSNHGPLCKRRKRYAIMLCVGIVLVAYSAKTINRNVDWHNEESLYRSAIQINPPKGNYITFSTHYSMGYVCTVHFVCVSVRVCVCVSVAREASGSSHHFTLICTHYVCEAKPYRR